MSTGGMKGSPPVPNEVKRRRGNPGKRPLPDLATVEILPSVEDGWPEMPAHFGEDGQRLWTAAFRLAKSWLSAAEAPFELWWLCEAADERRAIRDAVMSGAESLRPRLREVTAEMIRLTNDLALNPTQRSKLGVAEVKAKSELEKLKEQKARRASGS